MREILFRGKRLDNGEWVEGFYLQTGKEFHGIKKHLIAIDGRVCDYAGNDFVDVDPLTIGQFTGRTAQCTDKIFEGDRCVVTTFDHNGEDYQHECVVLWDDGTLAFSNEKHEFWLPIACVEDTNSDVEVIGTIHDKEGANVNH